MEEIKPTMLDVGFIDDSIQPNYWECVSSQAFKVGFPTVTFIYKEINEIELQEGKIRDNKIRDYALKHNVDLSKFSYPEICEKCGSIYDGGDTSFIQNGKHYCKNCWVIPKEPYFAKYIPTYCDGYPLTIFTFIDKADLYNKLQDELSENEIIVQDDQHIMSQNIQKSFWWVLGGINNYNKSMLNLPKFDSSIYNSKGIAIKNKVDKMLANKDIVKKDIIKIS